VNIRLEIEANSPDQLRRVLAEILGAGVVASATEFTESGEDAVAATGLPIFNNVEAVASPDAPPPPAAEAPKPRGRKPKAEAAPPATPASPPAPSGTGETTAPTSEPGAPVPPPPPAPDAPPPPPPPAPAVAGEITVDSLRNLMASVMAAAPAGKGIPASTVQQALKAACGGVGSIAQLPVEQYANAHAALSAL